MVRNQGIRIGVFLLCLSLSFNILGGIGMGQLVGVDPNTGLPGEEFNERSEIQNPEPDSGNDVGNVLGLVQGSLGVVETMGALVAGTYGAAVALRVPHEIAVALQVAVDVGLAIGIAQVIRGMRF